MGGNLVARPAEEQPSFRPSLRSAAISALDRIEVVRGRLDDAVRAELLAFWAQHGALEGAEAQERLPEVVCVLRGEDGEIAGACSAFAAQAPLIGRPMWVHRSLLPGDAHERWFDLFAAAHAALDADDDGAEGEPVGLLALLDDSERAAHPQAEWADPRTIYAGYLADGRQLRAAYFTRAVSASAEPEASAYEIVPFAAQDAVGADDVVAMWTREGALPEAEARRRVEELHLVALDRAGAPAAVSTRYLQRNEQLRMDLWHYRAFTAREHRRSLVATGLAVRGRELLEEAFVSGRDTRAAGLIYEVESEVLRRAFPRPVWYPADVLLIGDGEQGAHVRVHYFAGALAPEPDA